VNRGNLTLAWRAAAVTLAVLAALTTALAVGGPFAVVVTAECLAALAVVVVLARTPAGLRARRAPQAAAWARAVRARLRPRRSPPAQVRSADFPAYAKISSDLSWQRSPNGTMTTGSARCSAACSSRCWPSATGWTWPGIRPVPATWSATISGRSSTPPGRLRSTARHPGLTCVP